MTGCVKYDCHDKVSHKAPRKKKNFCSFGLEFEKNIVIVEISALEYV